MALWIEADKCTGCGRCLAACVYDGVRVADGRAVLTERCTQCGACLETCREKALVSDGGERPIPDFRDHAGVWVIAEATAGRLHPVSLELLAKARSLAEELGQETAALLLGHQVEPLAETLLNHGAQAVHLVEHELLAAYLTRPFTAACAQVLRAARPSILLLGATPKGRDLGPRLARRLGLGLTADCTDLAIDPKERILRQTRPAFGGNVMATIVTRYSRPQMATVRPGIFPARPAGPGEGRVVRHRVVLEPADLGATILKTVPAESRPVDLAQARVVVAGGRGVTDASGFQLLRELADLLGGEVGGSRVACEAGLIPPERQIGQTGATIRPELYVAVGISGALQHRAGVLDSRYIAAINKDAAAPIFGVADFGLVGDYRALVPALLKALKEA